MRKNIVREKLRRGEPCFGTWLVLGSLHATRVLARGGFDWLTIDLEHAALDWSQAALLMAAVADAGGTPLCRVPAGNHDHIKRALDAGAMGIVVPMVDTVDQARTAIAAAKYPPQGNRSAGSGMHALNFAATPAEYYARANEEILVVLQTESPQGIANAAAIYALPGCDAVFVGPLDLSFHLRSPDGRPPSDEEFEAAIAQVIAAGRAAGTPTGIHARDAQEALRRAAQGMQMIAVSTDLELLAASMRGTLDALAPGRGRHAG